MGKKASKDEVNFNYPIPKDIHKKVKLLSADTCMSIKDIMINALIMYVNEYRKSEETTYGDDL